MSISNPASMSKATVGNGTPDVSKAQPTKTNSNAIGRAASGTSKTNQSIMTVYSSLKAGPVAMPKQEKTDQRQPDHADAEPLLNVQRP